jgi:hypothetical protein
MSKRELDVTKPGRVVNVAGNEAFRSRIKPRARTLLTPEQKLWADAVQAATDLHALGVQPNVDTIARKLQGRWSRKSLNELLATEKWEGAMERRGIAWTDAEVLTPLQQSFLQFYFDTSTPATHQMKLRQANVTGPMFQGWMRQPVFAREMERLRQVVLKDGFALATQRLVELADAGDLKAIDRVMAFNGDDFRTLTGEDVSAILLAVYEILDEDRVPTGTMNRIAQKVQLITGRAGATMAPVAPVYTLPPEETL